MATLGCARFPEILLNFSEPQICGVLWAVVFYALKLKLPIQASLSVTPEFPVSLRSGENCPNFSKTSTLPLTLFVFKALLLVTICVTELEVCISVPAIMKMRLIVVFATLVVNANCNDNNLIAEMKAKIDAMEDRLVEVDALKKRQEDIEKREEVVETRVTALEQQQGKVLFIQIAHG